MEANDFAGIKARMRAIRVEESRPDDEIKTAIGSDLEAIAAKCGLERREGEYDSQLRTRIEVAIYHR